MDVELRHPVVGEVVARVAVVALAGLQCVVGHRGAMMNYGMMKAFMFYLTGTYIGFSSQGSAKLCAFRKAIAL